ncbi:ferredoxin [Mycolicibacterium sp.]|uniref:ferredoxin n=1 Tax=Mycolicibacterium sp. TaxID=2320850 RepID=UPI001D41E8F9|nr:ferredoxin [Mycolicibacterium sp.]MCB1292418.1 ferredoxin [Mycobacterium sp.]MCB9409429.1 ferredoxin [Mycolicibacterium sp.]
MKIVVDRTKCSSIGLCEATAPDIFEIGADGALTILMDEIPADRRDDLESACENCPTQALSIEE